MASKLMKKNQFWDNVEIWSTPIVANMLWLLLSMLLITMPLGIVGLFATIFHWAETGRTQVFSLFGGTIRRVWLKAYLLFLLDVAIIAFLTFNLFIFNLMEMDDVLAFISRSATLFSAIVFIAINIPAWFLVATWDSSLKEILSFSVRLVFAEPLWILAITIGFFLPFVIGLYLPAIILVFITGAVAAYIAYKGLTRLIYKYIEREDFRVIEIS